MKRCFREIEIPLYNKVLIFAFGYKKETILKKLEDFNLTDYDRDDFKVAFNSSDGFVLTLEDCTQILYMHNQPNINTKHLAILQHEIFHVVANLMGMTGIKLTNESDEAYAYLIQYLTKEILDIIL